jgi:hypothetical protein
MLLSYRRDYKFCFLSVTVPIHNHSFNFTLIVCYMSRVATLCHVHTREVTADSSQHSNRRQSQRTIEGISQHAGTMLAQQVQTHYAQDRVGNTQKQRESANLT